MSKLLKKPRRISPPRDNLLEKAPFQPVRGEMMEPDERANREELARRAVLNGDERAWQTLYDGTFEALYRYVHWRLAGIAETVEEVVQETWMTAVRRIRQFDPAKGRFEDWLRGIAANVVRNRLRQENGRRGTTHSWKGEPGTDPPPDAPTEQQERAESVARALAALPAHYEEILRAKYVDRLTMAEIARARQESVKAVESRLTRARQAFRDAYGQQQDL